MKRDLPRASLAKPDCDNCHGTGSWHDTVFDEERQCPCVITGEALKKPASRPGEARCPKHPDFLEPGCETCAAEHAATMATQRSETAGDESVTRVREAIDAMLGWPTWARLPTEATRHILAASRILHGEPDPCRESPSLFVHGPCVELTKAMKRETEDLRDYAAHLKETTEADQAELVKLHAELDALRATLERVRDEVSGETSNMISRGEKERAIGCAVALDILEGALDAPPACASTPACPECGGTGETEDDATGALGYVVKRACPRGCAPARTAGLPFPPGAKSPKVIGDPTPAEVHADIVATGQAAEMSDDAFRRLAAASSGGVESETRNDEYEWMVGVRPPQKKGSP